MILTEDEARKKWCPMSRVAVDTESAFRVAYNRIISQDGLNATGIAMRCIASDCAMWREAQTVETEINDTWFIYDPPKGWRYVVSFDDGMAKFERTLSDAPKSGYCGLAGKP